MRALIWIGLAVTFAVVSWFWLSSSAPEIKNYPSANNGIIVLGDSLAEGEGATEGKDLFSLLGNRVGETIINYGRGGDTTALALERLPQVLEEFPNPKIAIILLGGNDFLRKIPVEQTFSNLSTIIEEFQGRGAVVLLLGIRGGVIKDNFDEEFEKLHKRYGTAFVPNILKGLITKREYMYDSIHPNDKGYEHIADRVYPVLREIIK